VAEWCVCVCVGPVSSSRWWPEAVLVWSTAKIRNETITIVQMTIDEILSNLTNGETTPLDYGRPVELLDRYTSDLGAARERLLEELRQHALVIGEVTLTSGARAQYYVDAKRAILRPEGFAALAALVAARAFEWDATAVGGITMGADAPTCAALAGGARVKGFFVRKDAKAHGLQRRVEGPALDADDRCLVVEDVVTTGGSTLAAIAALHEQGLTVCGVVSVLDRLTGGGEAIAAAAGAPYVALSTIDEVYPERPDRRRD
jgi:orotate phosphoribosyltransferase